MVSPEIITIARMHEKNHTLFKPAYTALTSQKANECTFNS